MTIHLPLAHGFEHPAPRVSTGSTLPSHPRVLVASAWLNPSRSYDIAVWQKRRRLFSVNAPIDQHFGLRFLKANLPHLEVLEYPTKEEYLHRLKEPWDVVGISFYINETHDAVAMARAARASGVKHVWGGNYGAMNAAIASEFDWVGRGWGEEAVATRLGVDVGALVHPPLYMNIYWRGLRVQRWGVLFTSRGCNEACTFCQTPRFYGRPRVLSLEAIGRVLNEYKRRRVGQVIILDENFGHFVEHTHDVLRLLKASGLKWNPLTRVETIYRDYEEWRENGLCGASLGLESLNQLSLDGSRKGLSSDRGRQLLQWMRRDGLLTQVFYILGFEQDTETSIQRDIIELSHYHIDSPQIQILTPYPETPLFRAIEKRFGILDRDWAHYDSTHLVWNHPHVTPSRMRALQAWANERLFTGRQSRRTLAKIARRGLSQTLRDARNTPLWSGRIDAPAGAG